VPVQQYGITLFMSKDEKIKEFLQNIFEKAEQWLAENKVEKFTMIISNVHTKEVLERWDFKIDSEFDQNKDTNNTDPSNPTSSKDLKKIQDEIRAVMRQIAATVSYLPLLECLCSFDLHLHTLKDCEIPENWNETENAVIVNSQQVNLKSFSTGLQKVETVVSYKMTE
jgi:mitotic spindle assembly checkpoint protein MAD2